MAIIDPIYSIEEKAAVYHNNSECKERKSIETKNVRPGIGGQPICPQCRQLNIMENWRKIINKYGLGLTDPIPAGGLL
jgi:hypothetical protein